MAVLRSVTALIALAAFTLGVIVDQLVTACGAAFEEAQERRAALKRDESQSETLGARLR